MTGVRAAVRAAVQDVRAAVAELEQNFARLTPLADQFAGIVRATRSRAQRPTREDLSALRPTIFDILDGHRGAVAGAGVITVPELLADASRWLEWWWTGSTGAPEALRVNLDESSADFFDYTAADWYGVPLARGGRFAAGPYVDYFCTNEYTITFAMPVHVAGAPVGVAAADVLVGELERRLVPLLRAVGESAVLASGDGRVIASASPRLAPGERVDLAGARSVPHPHRERAADAGLHWRLLTAASA